MENLLYFSAENQKYLLFIRSYNVRIGHGRNFCKLTIFPLTNFRKMAV